MIRALPSLNRGSLEIRRTVSLKGKLYISCRLFLFLKSSLVIRALPPLNRGSLEIRRAVSLKMKLYITCRLFLFLIIGFTTACATRATNILNRFQVVI